MYTKASIFNLALGALLLSRQVTDPATDIGNEVRVLNNHWDVAFKSAVSDMDLDSMMQPFTLALIEEDPTETPEWKYVYAYPANSVFLRRIRPVACSYAQGPSVDTRDSIIRLATGVYTGQKAIFTNEEDAVAECIFSNLSLSTLEANAGLAIAYRLAWLSSALIVGKGAMQLRQQIMQMYAVAKSDAQRMDGLENRSRRFEADNIQSEFVAARIE